MRPASCRSIVLYALVVIRPCAAAPTMSTEDFLNRLGVNTHLNGLTAADPWNTNTEQVAGQLRYIGVRIDRDWAWSMEDGRKWNEVRKAWSPYGRFWTSIDEGSPATQRKALALTKAIWAKYPGLIYAVGGPNEEDDEYPQSQGATLTDSTEVQRLLYTWAHSGGRNAPVSQMEFGAGWTADNGWQGDYNPKETGIHQPYTPGPADLAAAHTYLSNPNQRPIDVLNQLRALARITTPGNPVAHTEVGAYQGAKLSPELYGRYMVMGALDSAAAGDSGFLVYGLQDSAPEQTYGFFTYPGGKPHPAAEYFHTLTALLKSAKGAYGPGEKPTFRPGALGLTFSEPSSGRLVLQKPTGEFVIALWSEQLVNGTEHPVSQTVRFGKNVETVRIFCVSQGMSPVAVLRQVSGYTMTLRSNETYLLVLSSAKSMGKPGTGSMAGNGKRR